MLALPREPCQIATRADALIDSTAVREGLHYNAAAMRVPPAACDSILETIGNTPLVRIRRMNPEPGAPIYAKIEGCNPMGSVKERIALRIVEEAERRGE